MNAAPALRPNIPSSSAKVESSPEGEQLLAFLKSVDVVIAFEKLPLEAFDLAHREGKRVVYVPNLDWATLGRSPQKWIKAVAQRPWIDVWAKQPTVRDALQRVGVAAEYLPWSIPDEVVSSRDARSGSVVTFLINAGNGGYKGRRGVDLALRAFQEARRRSTRVLRLVVKTNRSLDTYVAGHLLSAESLQGVEVVEGFVPREDLHRLSESADVVIHPSRWEGFGIPLLEALHAGLPVLVTDGWPIADMIEHGHNGLRVSAKRKGGRNLAPCWEIDVRKLAGAMVQIAEDEELRDRLTCPSPGELLARQHAFRLRARQRLLGEREPHAYVVKSQRPCESRRSEEYWADALVQCGYRVTRTTAGPAALRGIAGDDPDLVLVGKPPVDFVHKLQRLSVFTVLWHHDSDEHVHSWFSKVQNHVDLACVPHEPLPHYGSHVRLVHPGPRSTGSRGPGRRSAFERSRRGRAGAVFVGKASKERSRLMKKLARALPLAVHGPGRQPLWDNAADAAYRRAVMVLSISRHRATKIPMYTSNRLFHATGVGAYVAAERFPGIEVLFPQGVDVFDTAEEAGALYRRAAQCREAAAKTARRGEKECWRHHSWEHRALQILELVNEMQTTTEMPDRSSDRSPDAVCAPMGHWARYWNTRALAYGPRATARVALTETQYERETRHWWDAIWRVVAPSITGDEAVLDFGCGAGRFGLLLGQQGLAVRGADVAPAMVSMARKHIDAHLYDGKTLPFEDDTFDMLWSCTVLQHVPDGEIRLVAREIRRVLRPRALVVLFENTTAGPRTSRSGHVVFRTAAEYVSLFPGISARGRIRAGREYHEILTGRCTP